MNGPFDRTFPSGPVTIPTGRSIDDLGKYLQVTVRYRDNVSGADITEKEKVSAYVVRKDTVSSNADPKYPDQRILVGGTHHANTYAARLETEKVHTRKLAGRNPLSARQSRPSTTRQAFDVITYSLSDTTPAEWRFAQVFRHQFEPTGQITVSAQRREVEPGAMTLWMG